MLNSFWEKYGKVVECEFTRLQGVFATQSTGNRADTWQTFNEYRSQTNRLLSQRDDLDAAVDVSEAERPFGCLLYTSDAADERSSVDLGGRRIIKKKHRH